MDTVATAGTTTTVSTDDPAGSTLAFAHATEKRARNPRARR
jgi:hypothetical protein